MIEFEFACCLFLVGCVFFVNEPGRISTPCSWRMSRIVQRSASASLAASPSEIRSRSWRGDRSCDSLVFVVLEIFAHELAQRIALASKHASLDNTLDQEVEVVRI